MKKIIVPTDFSKCALQALKAAAKIAEKTNATIHLLHCYERPIYGFVDLTVDNAKNKAIIKSINVEMKKLCAEKFLDGIKIKSKLYPDISIKNLPEQKFVKSADLIVIGTHGIDKWRDEVIGSNAQKIVRFSDCPVMVIKESTESFQFNNVVFASNFHKEVDLVFNKIKKLYDIFNPKIHLLRVVTQSQFKSTVKCEKIMNDFAEKHNLKNFTTNVHNAYTVEDGIIEFSERTNVDVISLETHGRTGVAQVLNSSIAENIANHAPHPILSVKIQQQKS